MTSSPQLLSVIICTHNPRQNYLLRVIDGLQKQTLSLNKWELVLIDNASSEPFTQWIDLSWHPHARSVVEPQLGLTAARQRALKEVQTDVLVFVDDDNILAKNYLEQVVTILATRPKLGAIGGRCLPEFEQPPEPWFPETGIPLGLRDFGDIEKVCSWYQPTITNNVSKQAESTSQENQYPKFAPIGAGLVIRKEAIALYCQQLDCDPSHLALGRKGQQLSSGEDNDIMLTLLEHDWSVGYFPQLQLLHLIKASRLDKQYLCRMNRASCRSWVKVLDLHNLRPWPTIAAWTVPLRKLKAYLSIRPWTSPVAAIRWHGACGLIEGQANLS